jgi:hypothetical protein
MGPAIPDKKVAIQRIFAMKRQKKTIAIQCKLLPGMFNSERVFEIKMANGENYRGVAPAHFCWDENDQLLGENSKPIEEMGKVAARIVEYLDEGPLAVEVPDGEVIAINENEALERPTKITPPNPSMKREPEDVSV